MDQISIEPCEQTFDAATLNSTQLTWIVIALQLCLLLAALDQTVVSCAMPRIIAQLNGFDRYAWATTIYLLTSTAAVLVFGRISDIYGRKGILMLGISTFVVSSFLCGNAGLINLGLDGMGQLILMRALQGAACGIILALSFTVIADLFSPAERGKYQGYFAAVFALASVAGPSLGGFIADNFSWRWIFFMNIPLGLLAMAVLHGSFPDLKTGVLRPSIDYKGLVFLLGFLLPFLLALTWVTEIGWTAPSVLCLLGVAAVMFLVFLQSEREAAEPMVPLCLFKDSTVTIACFSLFITGIGMFGSILLIPLFMQSVVGLSGAISGVLLSPLMVTVAGASIVSGQIIARTGRYRMLVLSGLALMTLGVWLLSVLGSSASLIVIVGSMLVVGIGLGILLPIYTIVLQSTVPPEMMGITTALSQFFRSIGGTVGTAVFGSIMLGYYRSRLVQNLPHDLPGGALLLLQNPINLLKLKSELALVLANLPNSGRLAETILLTVRDSLVYAINGVFLIYALILSLTLVINCFLKEVPLRGSKQSKSS